MTGLETALSVVQHTMIETGLMGWADFARVTSTAPAAIGRLEDQGRPLDAGEPANVTLVDPAARWTVTLLRWQPWAVTLRLPAGNFPARWWRRSSRATPPSSTANSTPRTGGSPKHRPHRDDRGGPQLMDKLPFFLIMLALAVGIFALLAVGWRNRLRRQADVDPLPEIPGALGAALAVADGQYVASTTAGDWLDRIAVHNLGIRTNAELSVHPEGVLFDRSGAAPVLIRPQASPACGRKAAWPGSSSKRTDCWCSAGCSAPANWIPGSGPGTPTTKPSSSTPCKI